MQIHLSDILSVEGKKCSYTVPVGFNKFSYNGNEFKIGNSSDAKIVLFNEGDQKLSINMSGDVTFLLPCDRCLEETSVPIHYNILTEADMKEPHNDNLSESEIEAEKDRLDNQTFIEGYQLDTDKLLLQELILRIPEKVLCKEDCKGICFKCGANLNNGQCNCKEEPKDIRMAQFLDIMSSLPKE